MDYPCTWWEKIGETDWDPPVRAIPSASSVLQVRSKSSIFRNLATGQECLAKELPIGALYSVDRSGAKDLNSWPPAGADGLSIVCVCIGHHWYIDYRAANCTKPDDRVHRCWVRHGTVGDKLTVDKDGNTCAAGAGSFFMDNQQWHGFLRNGVLVQA